MSKEDEIFLAKLNDAKVKAEFNNRMTLFKFLNLHEQQLVEYYAGKDVFVYFSSGFADGEYKRCIISPFEIEPDFKIAILEVFYDQRYITLGHRNILGALMSLGIERNVIGDIVLNDGRYYVACMDEMKKYIINEVRNANVRFSLEETKINLEGVCDEYQIKLYFLASMRLDVCIAQVYNLSRNDAYEFITKGLVKVNHKECLNPSKLVDVNDIISVRTKGRIKVFSINENTRSGRIKVELGRL